MEVITQQHIDSKILVIRGIQVIPDKDLAVSQNAIPFRQNLGGYLPYAFTEQGVAAVSAVLKSVKATIYTSTISKELKLDLQKHNAQYPSIEINTFNNSHDRFLIIDRQELYLIGASLKDLGKKWFAFSRMDSFTREVINKLNV